MSVNLLAGSEESAKFLYQTHDWQRYQSLDSLCQIIGVTREKIPRVLLKELTDNALDALDLNGNDSDLDRNYDPVADFFWCEDGSHVDCCDRGPGIAPELLGHFFSLSRPLSTSKMLRMPTRGRLGLGLRVVTGAVIALGGTLEVATQGRWYEIQFDEKTGRSMAIETGETSDAGGFRVVASLGASLPNDKWAVPWIDRGINFFSASKTNRYKGKTSAHWYDSDGFWNVFRASGERKVGDLISQFEGTSKKERAIAGHLFDRPCNDLSLQEAEELLIRMREETSPVKPKRLGLVGETELGKPVQSSFFITLKPAKGKLSAQIPVVLEVWGEFSTNNEDSLEIYLNRSPLLDDVAVNRSFSSKTTLELLGCGIGSGKGFYYENHAEVQGAPRKSVHLVCNVQTPYIPALSDSKTPDLSYAKSQLVSALERLVGKLKRKAPKGEKRLTQKAVIKNHLEDAIAKAGGDGKHRYSLRQLYYAVRPYVMDELGVGLDYANFTQAITDIESDRGKDLPGMYRDERGTVYHPHVHQWINLGTLSVEEYTRPSWVFHRVLYCEKEGLFQILIDDGWPEKWDCLLMTSKGYASRAARDLLDLLGETGEPLEVFCLHDFDAAGTMIYQSLVKETKARPGRNVEVIDLGLTYDDVSEMDLQIEQLDRKNRDRRLPVADHISDDEADWLQQNRCELNAMTSPQLLEFLERKMKENSDLSQKLIPSGKVMVEEFRSEFEHSFRDQYIDHHLRQHEVAKEVEELLGNAKPNVTEEDCLEQIANSFHEDLTRLWREPVNELAQGEAARYLRGVTSGG